MRHTLGVCLIRAIDAIKFHAHGNGDAGVGGLFSWPLEQALIMSARCATGREVWHAGRRIEDVTAHSGFTGTIKTLADLYDKQHTSEYREVMTLEHEGERLSCGYLAPKNAEQLAQKRRNIEFWAQQTFGQMGRYPDFCAQLVVGLFDWAHVIEKYDKRWADNARNYYLHCRRNDLCLTHALTDQYYDRSSERVNSKTRI